MQNDELTIEDIHEMSPDDVNANWPAVSEALTADRHREPADVDDATDAETPGQTGQQPLNAHLAGTEHRPLDLATIKRMSVEEYEANKPAVDAYMSRGRAA